MKINLRFIHICSFQPPLLSSCHVSIQSFTVGLQLVSHAQLSGDSVLVRFRPYQLSTLIVYEIKIFTLRTLPWLYCEGLQTLYHLRLLIWDVYLVRFSTVPRIFLQIRQLWFYRTLLISSNLGLHKHWSLRLLIRVFDIPSSIPIEW